MYLHCQLVISLSGVDLDLCTPPLDGTILPGVTRNSVIALAAAHSSETPLPNLAPSMRLHIHEAKITMADLLSSSAAETLLEAFCVGTAAVVASVGRIGYEGKDIVLPEQKGGLGPVSGAFHERITAIQEGRYKWEDWSVSCE